MKVFFRQSFERDTNKLPINFKIKLSALLSEIIKIEKISDIRHCRKLSGHNSAYRIKINRYRIGFYYENNTIELVRVLDRKEIYRFFP